MTKQAINPGLLECLNDPEGIMGELTPVEASWLAVEISYYRCVLRERAKRVTSQGLREVAKEAGIPYERARGVIEARCGTVVRPGARFEVKRQKTPEGLRYVLVETSIRGKLLQRIPFDVEYIDPVNGKRTRWRSVSSSVEADVRRLIKTLRRRRRSALSREPWWASTIRPTAPPPTPRVAAIARRWAEDWHMFGAKLRRCQAVDPKTGDSTCCVPGGAFFVAHTSEKECARCRRLWSGATRWRRRQGAA
jgi:hypothetical protein